MGHLDRPGASAPPFNSMLETGILALFVLEAFYPRLCDLLEMTLLDYLVVHTGDLSGEDAPQSLHPNLPNRAGELVVRRQLVEKSLRMMQEMHLIDVFETEEGVTFGASEDAPSYLDLLQAPYSLALKDRAQWIAHRFANITAAEMREQMQSSIGRWTADFRFEEKFDGARP